MYDLEKINKQNNFKIPNDYFDEFPTKIKNKIDMERKFSWENLKFKPIISFSLSFAFLFFLWFTILNNLNFENFNNSDKNNNISKIDLDTNFVDEIYVYAENIKENTLINFLTEDTIKEENLEDDEIIEFLLEENFDEILIAESNF